MYESLKYNLNLNRVNYIKYKIYLKAILWLICSHTVTSITNFQFHLEKYSLNLTYLRILIKIALVTYFILNLKGDYCYCFK